MDPFVPPKKTGRGREEGWRKKRAKGRKVRRSNETEEARAGEEGDAKMKMKGMEYDHNGEMGGRKEVNEGRNCR